MDILLHSLGLMFMGAIMAAGVIFVFTAFLVRFGWYKRRFDDVAFLVGYVPASWEVEREKLIAPLQGDISREPDQVSSDPDPDKSMQDYEYRYFIAYQVKTAAGEGFGNASFSRSKPIVGSRDLQQIAEALEANMLQQEAIRGSVCIMNWIRFDNPPTSNTPADLPTDESKFTLRVVGGRMAA